MSSTIWIDTSKELTVEFGNTIEFLKVFDDLRDTYNLATDYPDLDLVPDQTMHTDDCDPQWFTRARRQAATLLSGHRSELSEHAVWVLETLIES